MYKEKKSNQPIFPFLEQVQYNPNNFVFGLTTWTELPVKFTFPIQFSLYYHNITFR